MRLPLLLLKQINDWCGFTTLNQFNSERLDHFEMLETENVIRKKSQLGNRPKRSTSHLLQSCTKNNALFVDNEV